jgi:S-DNA-T family DNA segregation ATPase FtsK/SpoIIIE
MGTGLEFTQLSFSMADAARLARITQAAHDWVEAHPDWAVRRPWCEPLPAVLMTMPPNLLCAHNPRTSTALTFGLSDLPHEQRQELAVWDPAHDGHLHVQGGLGSGRSTTLRTLTRAAHDRGLTVLALSTPEQLWDCVVDQERGSTNTFPRKAILVIDDLDALIASFNIEHREAFLAALQIRLRTSPAEQTWFVIGTLDHGSTCAWVSQLVRTSLTLEAPTRGSAPGRCVWHGHETRVLHRPAASGNTASGNTASGITAAAVRATELTPLRPQTWLAGQSYLVVTHRVRQIIHQLREHRIPTDAVHDVGLPMVVEPTNPAHPRIYVGDAESWQANYNLLGQLRREATLIFDGCTPSEVRSLRLHRGLLPHAEPGHALAVTPDGEIHRIDLAAEWPATAAESCAA